MNPNFYKKLIQQSPFGYAYHKIILNEESSPVDYEFLEVNSAFENLTGLKAKDVIGERISKIIPTIVNGKFNWISFYGDVALNVTEKEFEQFMPTLQKWYKVYVYSPEKYYFVTVFIDITAEKETQEELERFFTVNIDLLCIADNTGRFIKVNTAWENLLGYSIFELENSNFMDYIHPDDIENTYKEMEKLGLGEKVINFVNRYRAKDDSYRFLEWRSHPYENLIYAAARDITERIEFEEEIKESKEKYELIFETIPDAVIITRLKDGLIADVNKGFQNLTGYERDELIGKTFIELGILDNADVRRNIVTIVEEKQFYSNYELTINDKYQNRIDTLSSSSIINIKDNLHMLSIIKNVSEIKKTQEELKLSQITFSGIINSVNEAIYIQDEDGKFLDVNDAVVKLYGYEKEYFYGKSPEILSAPGMNNLDEIIKAIKKVKDGEPQTFEFWGISKDGRIFPKEVSLSPGTYYGKKAIIAVARDISERKNNEEKIKALSQAVEQSPASIIITDMNANIQYVNKKTLEMTGYLLDELIGQNPRILKSNLYNKEVYKEMWENISSGLEWSGEFQNRKKNGELYWENALLSPIFDENGNILQYLAIKEDITKRKKEQEELFLLNEEIKKAKERIELSLEQKNQLIDELMKTREELVKNNSEKDKFFSIIAHDLKNPFQGFLGLTELMVSGVQDMKLSEIQEFGTLLRDSANNLYKLLENLLEWSRMQRGIVDFKLEYVNLHNIVTQSVNIFKTSAVHKKITIINKVTEDIVLYVDNAMITATIRNILNNAIKFTNENGNVEIGVSSKSNKNMKEYYQIYIKDSGIGMPEDILNDLFKIDKVVSRPGTEGEASSGLGLLLCKEYIDKNNGKLWVESKENVGTTFYIEIPIINSIKENTVL